MSYLGDLTEDQTVTFHWDSNDSNGASVTRTTDGTVKVLRDDAQDCTGTSVTDTEDTPDTGVHTCAVDTNDNANYITGHDYTVWLDGAVIDGQTVNAALATFSIENRYEVISAAAAANLEDTYDGTGYTNDVAPATQSQVSNIGSGATGATNHEITDDNVDGALTYGGAFVGVQTAGTYATTAADPSTYHNIDGAGAGDDNINLVYKTNVGGTRQLVNILFQGYLNGSNDVCQIQLYDFDGDDWETIYTLTGNNGSVNLVEPPIRALSKHTGTGTELGDVYIRFVCDTQSNPSLYVGVLLAQAVSTFVSVGYANGAVWVDTVNGTAGTVSNVNGTADNAVKTWADALTIAGNVGLERFHIVNGSTITLSGNSDNYTLTGSNWSLVLDSQSCSDIYVKGASDVTGTCTGANPPDFEDCMFGAATLPPCHMTGCGFKGTITMGSAGDFYFDHCHSMVAGSSTPVLNWGSGLNSSNVSFRLYSGGMEMQHMGAGTGTYTLSFDCPVGQIIFNANCSATSEVELRGNHRLTNNATGLTINDDARIDTGQIDTALTDYDGPTNTEFEARTISSAAADNLEAYYDGTRPVLYVSTDGNDANDGSGWGKAFLTIGAAVAAASNGDEIVVGPGTYSEQVDLVASSKELTIRGVENNHTIVTHDTQNTMKLGDNCRLAHVQCVSTDANVGIGVYVDGDDVELDHVVGSGPKDGILVWTSTRVRLTSCAGTSGADGITISTSNDVVARNCLGYSDGSYHVEVEVRGIRVASSTGIQLINCVGRVVRANVAITFGSYGGGFVDEVQVTGGLYIAEITNGEASGDVAAIYASGAGVISVNGAGTSSANAGSGDAFDLKQISGVLAVSGVSYDTTKTSGTITNLDERACTSSLNTYDGPTNTEFEARTISSTAADNLELMYDDAITNGAVNDGSPSSSVFITNLTETSDDHYNGSAIVFTSGALKGQTPRPVNDYDGGTKTITVSPAFAEAPANSDTFLILGRIS